MKKKILSLMLAIVLAMGVFSGVCVINANAEELPNLLELYGCHPGFEEKLGPWGTSSANITRETDISFDGDKEVITAANRKQAKVMEKAVKITTSGTYTFTYYVRSFSHAKEFKMCASIDGSNGTVITISKGHNDWVKVEKNQNLSSGTYTFSVIQSDYSADNAPDLMIDGLTIKKSGSSQNYMVDLGDPGTNVGEDAYITDVSAKTGEAYALSTSMENGWALPTFGGTQAKTLFDEQGPGTYTFSFDVKKLYTNDLPIKIGAYVEVKNSKYPEKSNIIKNAGGEQTEVGADGWYHITAELEIKSSYTIDDVEYEVEQINFRPTQSTYSGAIETELMFDNFCLTKADYNANTGTITVKPVERTPYSEVQRSSRTGIGAIYYQMWFESLDEWWKIDTEKDFWNYANSNDYNSTQEARSLSVAEYQFHLPFFATINKSITQDQVGAAVRGEITNGVAEFPEFTQEIWTQEMEYAIDAGIDFMAYLWTYAGRHEDANESSYKYHIKTRGLNNRIKMCAILQNENQDIDSMVNAMTESYWYTIDGMPVVYIYGGNIVATEHFINNIRRKLAIAQKVKYGEVGVPAYIIVMGNNTIESAKEAEALNVDATGWYNTSTGYSSAEASEKTKVSLAALEKAVENGVDPADKPTTITRVAFSATARHNLNVLKKVAPIAQNGNISVAPVITLGYNTEPRIVNPVSWNEVPANGNKLSNSGISGELPTAEEMTEHVLNVLNYNKENASTFNANTVLIYAWNEFNEGGWFCPNIKLDEKGNVIEGEVNREYLDAVKTAITLYREHEAENKTYDVNGNVVTENIDIPVYNDNTVKINIKGSIDAIDLDSVTITANGKKVTPVVDVAAGTLTCAVEKNATMTISFSQMGLYSPIGIQYTGVKGTVLGTSEYSFTAYGNFTEFDVSYAEVEGELKTVTMFYINASGERVVFDNFVVDGDLVEKINNYPKLYQKKFKAFNVNGTSRKTAQEAIALIQGAQTEIEVEYVDSVEASATGFAVAKHENMTVEVNGQEALAKVEPFVLATFTAYEQKDGESFSYWVDENEQIISYNRVYTRYITGDVDISPVYGKAIRPVAVTVKVADNTDKLVLIAERSLSDDCQILEHGIILAEYNTGNLELSSVGENSQGKVYLGHRVNNGENVLNNGTYILTKGDKHSHGGTYSDQGTLLSFVAFVRYVDADDREYVEYSPIGKSNVVKAEPAPSLDFDEID